MDITTDIDTERAEREAKQRKDEKNRNVIFGIIAFVVLAIWVISWLTLSSNPDRGTFGDMFGGVNALFSGFAFLGLIYTISLQKTELGLQRQELADTRKELAGQRESMEKQNDFIEIQNFEGTFFQMLKLHNDLVNSMDVLVSTAKPLLTGRDCFMRFYELFRNSNPSSKNILNMSPQEIRQHKYDYIWKTFKNDLGCYFRSLYNIFKVLDESFVEDKKKYSNLVRAQLSEQELTIILYNGVYFKDSKFVTYIEEYSLLKHLAYSADSFEDFEVEHYKASAYGGTYPHK